MQEVKVSVLLPVYNCELFIGRAIESILSQTFTDFEFLIIDDGSTDRTKEIIKSYNDVRIRLISRPNRGLVYSLNEGLELCRGEFVARMDADDISYSQRIERQLDFMLHYGLDICGCDFDVLSSSGDIKAFVDVPKSDFPLVLALNVPFAHGSVFLRKQFLMDNGLKYGFTKHVKAEDYALWCTMCERGARFGNVSQTLFGYREVEGSLSSYKINAKHATLVSYDFVRENHMFLLKTVALQQASKLSDFSEEIGFILVANIFRLSFRELRRLNLSSLQHGLRRILIVFLIKFGLR